MPVETINGVGIFIEEFGSGDPLVLVHGSWVDAARWAFVVPALAERFRVVLYDRRGHSRSERPPTQGSVHEDVADLAAIIERAGAPAHVVANSFGASISLRLAAERRELFRTLSAHEPPLFALLRDDPQTGSLATADDEKMLAITNDLASGKHEEGARRFVDTVVIGPGTWDNALPEDVKRMMVNNAPTFLDELRDPEADRIDTAALARFSGPVLLSGGSESPLAFTAVLEKLAGILPHATRKIFEGAGHVPHFTHPQEYAQAIVDFIESASSANQ
jgi:pimeloyl-ACP methyl ester carboxylesterase